MLRYSQATHSLSHTHTLESTFKWVHQCKSVCVCRIIDVLCNSPGCHKHALLLLLWLEHTPPYVYFIIIMIIIMIINIIMLIRGVRRVVACIFNELKLLKMPPPVAVECDTQVPLSGVSSAAAIQTNTHTKNATNTYTHTCTHTHRERESNLTWNFIFVFTTGQFRILMNFIIAKWRQLKQQELR